MSFKDNNYTVIRNIISKDICKFVSDYLRIKRNAARTLYSRNWFTNGPVEEWGIFGDSQVEKAWSIYGDITTEVLLDRCTSLMEKELKIKLIPNYSYVRIYTKGDELTPHIDRKACEFSTTLNLGGDLWPIYLFPDIKIELNPGDMLIYKGTEIAHWRKPFEGRECVQTFLHYNEYRRGEDQMYYDTRPHLGLPSYTKINKDN